MKDRSQLHRVKKPDRCPKCGATAVQNNLRLAAPRTHSAAAHPECCSPATDPAWVCSACGEKIYRVLQ